VRPVERRRSQGFGTLTHGHRSFSLQSPCLIQGGRKITERASGPLPAGPHRIPFAGALRLSPGGTGQGAQGRTPRLRPCALPANPSSESGCANHRDTGAQSPQCTSVSLAPLKVRKRCSTAPAGDSAGRTGMGFWGSARLAGRTEDQRFRAGRLVKVRFFRVFVSDIVYPLRWFLREKSGTTGEVPPRPMTVCYIAGVRRTCLMRLA
jgi:hypothetical protein